MTGTTPVPSPRYQALMRLYATLHLEGDRHNGIPAEQVFDGRSLVPHIELLRSLCRRFAARSLLDYGCGKARSYAGTRAQQADGTRSQGLQQLWQLEEVALYDPAVEQHATLPRRLFDVAVATAVLEYTPEEDVRWVLAEILGFARRFAFLAIACHPSPWTLPSGENHHVTLRSPGWWTDRLLEAQQRAKDTRVFALLFPSERRPLLVEI